MVEASLAAIPEFGALQQVAYVFDDDLPRPIAVELRFEAGTLWLMADSEWDDLVVATEPPRGVRAPALSGSPWTAAVGRHCLWSWELRNQTGRLDGVQLLFAAPPNPDVCVQLMVAASQIDIYGVHQLDSG